ncbi:hypothetical protein XENORESO_001035 [Xenotaenia resolanae]|uniref:Uncharacterized protein n=1 Tax=Xenotaenia resolanae TaxID=208358 RepID=A0ABV0VWG3_9TELE
MNELRIVDEHNRCIQAVISSRVVQGVSCFSCIYFLQSRFRPLLCAGVLGWEDLVEGGLPHSYLLELAKAILMLFGLLQVKGWSTDSILSILEELIGILHQA